MLSLFRRHHRCAKQQCRRDRTEPSCTIFVLIFRRHSRTAVITVHCEFGAAATEKKRLGLKVEVGCLRTTCELSNLGPGDLPSGGWPSVEYLCPECSSGECRTVAEWRMDGGLSATECHGGGRTAHPRRRKEQAGCGSCAA